MIFGSFLKMALRVMFSLRVLPRSLLRATAAHGYARTIRIIQNDKAAKYDLQRTNERTSEERYIHTNKQTKKRRKSYSKKNIYNIIILTSVSKRMSRSRNERNILIFVCFSVCLVDNNHNHNSNNHNSNHNNHHNLPDQERAAEEISKSLETVLEPRDKRDQAEEAALLFLRRHELRDGLSPKLGQILHSTTDRQINK